MRIEIRDARGIPQVAYDVQDFEDLSLLSDSARAALLPEGASGPLCLDWRLVLAVRFARDADAPTDEAIQQIPGGLPGWMQDEDWDIVDQVLDRADSWPPAPPRLRVYAMGRAGTSGYSLKAEWIGESDRPIRPQPKVAGALGFSSPGAHEPGWMMTLGQYAVLAELERAGQLGGDRDSDLLATDRVRSAIPSGDPGVLLDPHLARMRVQRVERVKPQFLPTPTGYQLRPKVDGFPQDAVEDYYFGTPRTELGQRPLAVREGRERVRAVFGEQVAEGLQRCRELDEMSAEDVAHAMSHPEEVLGSALDLSEFSERVSGLGPEVRRVTPIIREIPKGEWWDWDVESEVQRVGEEPDEPGGGESLDLKDPDVRADLKQRIERAEARGDTFIPNPSGPGMLEVTANLKETIAAADKLQAESSSNNGRLERRPREVLQVKDNLESLVFDRAASTPVAPPANLGRPPGLAPEVNLHPHQKEGYAWLVSLYGGSAGHGTDWNGALLADDMGVGKTLQVLSFLAWLKTHDPTAPGLVVAPVGLLDNWEREARRFFGAALEPILVVRGRYLPSDPQVGAGRLAGQRMVLTSYETLRRHEQTFARVSWGVVVLDEAQKAKNVASQISRVVRTLKARFRLAMTGTPVENTLAELWTLYDWAVPGLLGSLRQFNEEYLKPLRGADPETQRALADRLQGRIAPVFTRRMKRQLQQLPTLTEKQRRVPLSSEQEAYYSEQIRARGGQGDALGRLIRLMGICAHPDFGKNSRELSSSLEHPFPKAQELWAILDGVRAAEEKAIIFANRKPLHRWLRSEIESRYGFRPDIIDGQVNESRERMRRIDRFSEAPGFRVIVLSTRAAGVGLNITAANHVIHYTREWNPAVEQQATDRAYRIGQTRPVQVHTLIGTSGQGITVEERLDQLLAQKRQLMNDFVVPMGGFEVSRSELDPGPAQG